MTVEELGARMSASEFQEWLAFSGEYGLPDAFFAAGQICTTTARSLTGADVTPASFVPLYRAAQQPVTAAEAAAKFRQRIDATLAGKRAAAAQKTRQIG